MARRTCRCPHMYSQMVPDRRTHQWGAITSPVYHDTSRESHAAVGYEGQTMRRGNALATQTKAVQTIHCWDPSSAAAQKKSASGGTSRNRRGCPFEIRQVATIPVPNSRQQNRSASLTAVQTVQPNNNTGPLGVHSLMPCHACNAKHAKAIQDMDTPST